MRLTRAAIAQPFLTALLTAALLLAGCLGWSRMPVDLNPRTELPSLIVTVIYPGAGPSTVEQLVAEPLEEQLRLVSAVDHVNTVSQEGACIGFVELADGADIDEAIEQCRQQLDFLRAELPDAVRPPTVVQLDINAQPIVYFGMTGERPLSELRRLADDQLRGVLEAVDGVASVAILGGREREVEVAVDRAALAATRLTMSELIGPLEAGSISAPAGRLEQADLASDARLSAEYATLDDIRAVALPPVVSADEAMRSMLRPPPTGRPTRRTRLGDIAQVEVVESEPDVRIRFGGREAVAVVVTKRGNANTVAVSRDVRLAAERAGLPADVRVAVARDQAAVVREALADVNTSIVLGVILCAGTILVFVRNLRSMLIVATSIPVCLIGTFALMAFGGHTINQMTLLGLALSVGILVDDSIVCLEAILFRMRRGEPAAEAAFQGRCDIALADTSTTLIDLAVFAPIAVMAGTVGQFFHDFGFVVAAAAALSLLVAYTLVPSLAARTFRDRPPAERPPWPWYTWLAARYDRALRWALAHRGPTLVAGWLALGLAGLLSWRALGVDFIPAADLGQIQINIEMPAGAGVAATERAVAQVESIARPSSHVETTLSTIGRIDAGFGLTARSGPRYAQVSLTLTHGRRPSDGELAAWLRRQLLVVADARIQVIPIRGWGGAGAPVDCSLYGSDFATMSAVGDEFQRLLQAEPGLLNVDRSWRMGQPEVQVRPDRRSAGEALVLPGALARELRACLVGETDAAIRLDGEPVAIRLRLRGLDRQNADDLAAIPVPGADRPLTVGDIATVTEATGPTRIDRRDGSRDLNFKAYLADGATLGDQQARIEAIWAELGVRREDQPADPAGRYPTLRYGWRGDAATMAEAGGIMAATALTGALLVYLIMAALFGSPIHPLTVMLSVPMAGTGALLLLVATGTSFSMVAAIGMVLLIGIVVRNAILLIDYILQARRGGIARDEAALQAGTRRLRPILMTTLTTILGMAPVALGLGKGAEVRAPMAIAVIGGLALSTLLTLIIVPVTYTLFDDWAGRPPVPPGRALEPMDE